MNIIKFDFNEMVTLQGNQVMTTSLKVAEYFGRSHKNVLRAIKNLECSDDFTKRNFELCFEINNLQNNKPQPFYKMTKDGFSNFNFNRCKNAPLPILQSTSITLTIQKRIT